MKTRRAAFTLAEIVVAMLLAVAVAAILWNILWADQRRFNVDQNRLEALQGAMLLDEYLTGDLEQIALFPVERVPREFDMNQPVVIEDSQRRLTFLRFDRTAPPAALRPVKVSYFVDPRTSRLTRQVGTETKPFRGFFVEELRFSVLPFSLDFATQPFTLRPTWGRDHSMLVLKYELTFISGIVREMPDARQKAHERVTLVGTIPMPYREERAHHGYWQVGSREILSAPSP